MDRQYFTFHTYQLQHPIYEAIPAAMGDGRAAYTKKGTVMIGFFEPLEYRQFLTGIATVSSWPNAPFSDGNIQATIYTNQKGYARLKNQSVGASPDSNAYALYFDGDFGGVTIETPSTDALDIAFYNNHGKPRVVSSDNNHEIAGNIPADKRTLYTAVKAGNGSLGSRYSLTVNGPPTSFVENVPISKVRYAGASGSDISDENDFDFYKFKLPRSGNWVVQVIPDKRPLPRLNATMNIYNSRGKPIGGSYSRAINAGRAGITEHWLGVDLKARTPYFVRVDGANRSLGGYGIAVFISPDESYVRLSAKEDHFVVKRSDATNKALNMQDHIAGSATIGIGSVEISDSIIAPTNYPFVTVMKSFIVFTHHDDNAVVFGFGTFGEWI